MQLKEYFHSHVLTYHTVAFYLCAFIQPQQQQQRQQYNNNNYIVVMVEYI